MKRITSFLLLLCVAVSTITAQRITHSFNNASMSDALKYIQQQTSKHKIIFIYNELEDFKVTTSVKGKSVPDAIKQVIGFYPIRMTQSGNNEIYVECTHKTDRHLTGRVIDEKGVPLEFAEVRLLNPSDSSYITGGITNASGVFVIPLDQPKVIAKFSYIGYKPVYKLCSRENVGTIQMQIEAAQLGEVTVKGAKRLVRSTERGLIANVQGTVLENFGSVNEMLSHLPMMMSDGTIAGHGKPEIYINNKKVRDGSELERLRADEILSAEIITTPGPEYGAEVTSVIKLKTVKRAGEGWSGSFSAFYSQGKECYANGNAALNYRLRNGMDFFARSFLTSNNQVVTASANDQLQASSVWDFKKETTFLNRYNYYFADLGWNWEISEKHSVGLTYTANNFITDATSSIETDEEVWCDGNFWEAETNKTVTFRKPRMEHTVNAYYVGEIGKWHLDFSADYYGGQSESDMVGGTIDEIGINSKTLTKNKLLAEKLVITAPTPKGTLTFGEEVSGVDRKSDFTQSGFSADNSVHQQTTTWSIFFNYALQVKKFGLNTGLRWQNEYNDYKTNGLKDAEQSPDYRVFIPRLSLNYRTEKWTHTLSYQCFRRNPAYSTLSTAINYRSKYEYQTGNPYLRPTTTHYFSWTTNYRWIRAELYYSYIKNINHSFQTAYDDTNRPGVILDDRRNLPKSQDYGLEINITPKIGIWQMNYTASFYFSDRDLKEIGITHRWNGLCTYFNLDNTLSLPHNWLINIRMDLTPYRESGCSQTKTTGGINLRLNRQFLKDKSLSVALIANDILHTRYIEMTAYGGINVRTQFREYRDTRRIGIDLSWKFNATRSRYKGSHAGQAERNRL